MLMLQENENGHLCRSRDQEQNSERSERRFKIAIEYRGDFLGSEGKEEIWDEVGIQVIILGEAQKQR